MNPILFENNNGIAKITFNRPKSYNSFNEEMGFAFQKCLDECAADNEIRVVVLTGEGKAFCAGQDISEIVVSGKNSELKKMLEKHYNPIVSKIRNLEKPIIAAVNGVAAGAGANIALACDIVVAAESVKFIQAFSAIGLIPDCGGTYFLPRLVGFQKALALAMLADRISATEAEKMGMIYKVFENDKFEEEVEKLATRMSKMPTKGLVLTKKAFNAALSNTYEEQLILEAELQIEAAQTADYKEGVQAFREKRKPNFKGR